MRILAQQLKDHIGKDVTIEGWLHKKRMLGGVNFILLRDRSGIAQVLIKQESDIKKLDQLQNGTIIKIKGRVAADKRAIGQAEIHNPNIEVVVAVKETMPIEIDKPISHQSKHLDSLFEHRILNLRNPTEKQIFIVSQVIESSLRSFFEDHDFTHIHTPKILATATEGGAEVFKLDYFGRQATLAQSPQFYKQIMVGVYERVYEIGPVFRAEPSTTTRHMSEYISVDAEIGFIDEMVDIMNLLSDLINQVVTDCFEKAADPLKVLTAKKPKLTKKFPSISLSQLHELYFKDSGQDTRAEKDPTPAEERFASQYALKKWGSEAIFITGFPSSEMKFYHKKDSQSPDQVERFDLIFRGVEIVTGSMREHRFDRLIEQLRESGANPEDLGYHYFLQAFRYGMPPHGGFGLGLERLVQKIIGLNNIKEASLFVRDMQRLMP